MHTSKSRASFGIVLSTLLLASIVRPLLAQASAENVDERIQAAMSLDAHPKHGAQTFEQFCRHCHGETGLGNAAREIPSLARQRQAYLIKQLADFAAGGRDSADMHRIITRSKLNDPQVWVDVAAYVNSLPVTRFPQKGAGNKLSLGEAVFQQHCSSCHEDDARGDDDGFVPSLRNQHYSYLLKQLHAFRGWHRRNVEDDLVRFFQALDEDELAAVADYLSRFEGAVRDRTRLSNSGVAGD